MKKTIVKIIVIEKNDNKKTIEYIKLTTAIVTLIVALIALLNSF